MNMSSLLINIIRRKILCQHVTRNDSSRLLHQLVLHLARIINVRHSRISRYYRLLTRLLLHRIIADVRRMVSDIPLRHNGLPILSVLTLVVLRLLVVARRVPRLLVSVLYVRKDGGGQRGR